MESIYYNKFRNLMKVLTKFWPRWDDYFSNKDVNIPGHTEKADFYIFCMKECSDVYEARHVEHDMVAGQGVDACKQAVIEIIKEMEEHVLKYREEHGMGGDPYLEYTNYGRDPYGDFVPDYEGNEDNEGEVLESYVEGSDNYPKEQAEQRYRVLKKKYLEYKLAKEKEKSKAEEDKANETISADADDNSIINEKPKEMTRDEFQDFVAGVKKDFKKFKEYMKELPAAWPEWEEHFSEMDVNIPGYEETADFYISYMDQCSDVYSLHHLIRDLRPYEDVFKQTLKNIVDTLEPHIKEYLEKKEINGNEPESELNNANKGRTVNDDFNEHEDSEYGEPEEDSYNEYEQAKNEPFNLNIHDDEEQIRKADAEELRREDEEAERSHKARIEKYREDKLAKEKAKEELEKTEAEVNEEDEVFDASEWVTVDKPHKKYSTRGEFDTVYQKLRQARNFTSSGQYDELLTMVKKMNESDDFKGSEVLDDEQKCVIRLLAIKSRINTYLKHKAVDGVKQNSYKKLAAVEELNELVSDRLSKMDFKEFNFNGENISKNSLNITYEQESEAYYNKESVRAKENAPVGWKDKEYRVKLLGAIERYPNVTLQEIRNVDRCMCRIILGALANDKVPVERINELKEQRTTFRENPGEKIVTEAVDNPARRM